MKTLAILLLACFSLSMAWAQNTPAGTPPATETDTAGTNQPKPAVKAEPLKLIRVDRIRKFNPAYWGDTLKQQRSALGTSLFPGDYVMVDVHPDDMDSAIARVSQLRLWMGGICFPDMKVIYTNPAQSFIVFKLERDTARTSPWQLFYTSPNYWEFHREVSMNLGTTATEYKDNVSHILTLHTSITWIPFVFYPLFLILLIFLARYGKGLIRDVSLYKRNGVKIIYDNTTKTNADKGIINIHDIPYSLSRLQFSLWLTVVFFGILHIWIITDVLTSPSASVLMLLGISGGTFYVGKLIDAPKQPDQRTPQQIVTDFMAQNERSQNPVLDILSDGNNISLHRLQLLIFTIFLAIYFVIEVITGLVMPEFSQTMMGLMGISSLTYAGLKTTEPATPAT